MMIMLILLLALLCVVLPGIGHKTLLIKGTKVGRYTLYGYLIRDIVNPFKWWSFVIGKFFKMYYPPHVIEQIMIRQYLCPECIEAGKCPACSCDLRAKILNKDESCALQRWGPIHKKRETWERIKNELGIKFMFKTKSDGEV